MPRDKEDVINDPINPEDFAADEPEEELVDFEEGDIPEDEEGDTVDPGDMDLGDDDIGDEEIDSIGDEALDDFGGGLGGGLDDDEFGDELNLGANADLPDMEQQPVAPEEQVRWTPVPQDNGDIRSDHVDGFVLRARPLSAQKGGKIKYVSQLYKDDRLIEKGVIWIDQQNDAREILQNIADRILDRTGLSNLSQMDAEKPLEDLGSGDEIEAL